MTEKKKMIEIEKTFIEQLGPRNITINNVMYWSRHSKRLKGTIREKALKFVKYECIRYLGQTFTYELKERYPGRYDNAKNIFICLPLNTNKEHNFLGHKIKKQAADVDYNNSEYIMYQDKDSKKWCCNCQGYKQKEEKGELSEDGIDCSHLLSLMYAFKLKKFVGKPKIETSYSLEEPDMEVLA